jgi:hypothetical protein
MGLLDMGVLFLPLLLSVSARPRIPSNGEVVVGPDYHIDPDLLARGNPKGTHFTFNMKLSDSAVFNGTDATLNKTKGIKTERKVFVYIPAAYVDGNPAAILVMQDGPFYSNNLICAIPLLSFAIITHLIRFAISQSARTKSSSLVWRRCRTPASTI